MKEISIALATYNGEKYLERQLESLATQSMRPTELVIRDDRSSDGTISILRDFAAKAQFPVRIIINERNLGAWRNFFELCKDTSGEYIAFCDQDDVWHPNKLKVCYEYMSMTGMLMVGHSVDLIDEHGKTIGRWKQGIRLKAGSYCRWDPWANFLGMSIMIDKKLLNLVDPERRFEMLNPHSGKDESSHDQWFDFLAESSGMLAAIDMPLASYRVHHANVSGVNRNLASTLTQLKVESGFAAMPDRRLALAAVKRSSLLQHVATHLEHGALRNAIVSSSRKWSLLSKIEAERLSMYRSRNPAWKLFALVKLICSGAYVGWQRGGLSPMLLLKDGLLLFMRHR